MAQVLLHGGHLFIDDDTNQINQQHQGRFGASDDTQAGWLQIQRDRFDKLAVDGIKYFFTLAPDKQTIYRHILPSSYNTRAASFLLQLSFVIDVVPALQAVSIWMDLYPKTDSHWNQLGSFIAAELVCARIGKVIPPVVIGWNETRRPGDLGSKLDPVEASPRLVARLAAKSYQIYDNLLPNNGRVRVFSKRIQAAEPGNRTCKLLMFGDSFSYDMIAFFKEAFDIVVHVHSASVDYELTNLFRPDFVISELTERFVVRLPHPRDGQPLRELWEEKIDRAERFEPDNQPSVAAIVDFLPEATEIVRTISKMFQPYSIRISTLSL